VNRPDWPTVPLLLVAAGPVFTGGVVDWSVPPDGTRFGFAADGAAPLAVPGPFGGD
jgi:hypothetical protein